MRSDLCVEHWLLLDSLCKHKSHRIITINGKRNVWKCKLIFPTDRLLQKIEITDLNHFLAAENTFLIVLAITVRHPQQHSIESVLGATGTADRMVVLHFGALHRCCPSVSSQMCSFRSCVARGSCKSHGWCILSHAHHAVSTPSVDNSNASSLCLESCGRLAQTLATGRSSQTPRHPSQIPCPRHRCSTAGERFPLPLHEASSAIPERAGLNRYQLQLFVSFLTTMTGCNPELSIHTQKSLNALILMCHHVPHQHKK